MRLIAAIMAAALLPVWAHAADIALQENYFASKDDPLSLQEFADIDSWQVTRWDCYHRKYSITQAEKIVHLSGRISAGDSKRFADLVAPYRVNLEETCPIVVVTLDLQGGEIVEAIKIGRQIAALGVPTIIGPAMECLSACLFAFAGGSYPEGQIKHMVLFAGAKLGLHKPQFRLDDRQKRLVESVQDPLDLVYRLAGDTWAEIANYLINERRNPYLFQAMFDSPTSGEEFTYVDTFEETYLAGIELIDTNRLPNQPGVTTYDQDIETAKRLMSPELAIHACALTKIKTGMTDDFSRSYATPVGPYYVVGLESIGKFCLVSVEEDSSEFHVCGFDSQFFWNNEEGMPLWLSEWGSGAAGFYPIVMFKPDYKDMTDSDRKDIASFFEEHDEQICTTDQAYFQATVFEALPRNQRLDAACKTPTRLCEPGAPLPGAQ